MQEAILKFPKPLKENKNIPNEISSKQEKTIFDRNSQYIKPAKTNIKDKKFLTKKELDEENKFLMASITKQEKKLETLSQNEKIKELFNMKSFISDNYKEYVALLNDYKNVKSLEMKPKERFKTFFFLSIFKRIFLKLEEKNWKKFLMKT